MRTSASPPGLSPSLTTASPTRTSSIHIFSVSLSGASTATCWITSANRLSSSALPSSGTRPPSVTNVTASPFSVGCASTISRAVLPPCLPSKL